VAEDNGFHAEGMFGSRHIFKSQYWELDNRISNI
jgi:hypothetical protein